MTAAIRNGWRRQIGACALEARGAKWITVRCPAEFAPSVRRAATYGTPRDGYGLLNGAAPIR